MTREPQRGTGESGRSDAAADGRSAPDPDSRRPNADRAPAGGPPPGASGLRPAWAGLLPADPLPAGSGTSVSQQGVVSGRFRPAPSKSLLQRALVLAALAPGETRLLGLERRHLADGDAAAAYGAARDLGAALSREGSDLLVRGAARAPSGRVAAGESGTLARLLTAVAALGLPGREGAPPTRVDARGTLLGRASPALARALEAAGARWEPRDGARAGGWPASITPVAGPRPASAGGAAGGALPELRLDAPGSSQEVSALWIALAARGAGGRVRVAGGIPSRPYLALTRASLAAFGVRVVASDVAAGADELFAVEGALAAPAGPLALEPDASSAAVALAAAALTGGELTIEGLGAGAAQGDVRILEHLAAFGCATEVGEATLTVRGAPTRGAELDLRGEPDLAPVLAAVAAAAALRLGAASRLTGLGTLPGKESDRLTVLATGLALAGFAVGIGADTLTVGPGPGPDTEGTSRPAGPSGPEGADSPLCLDPKGDHRMAFAFALLGLCVPNLRVSKPECVGKSWPDFWEDLESLGARVARAPRVHPASARPPGAPPR